MRQFNTFEPAIEITRRSLIRLGEQLDDCIGSEDSIAVLRKIARKRDDQAIAMLVSILDSPGPIGREAVRLLIALGPRVLPAVERVAEESLDKDAIDHAHTILTRLESAQAAIEAAAEAETAAPPLRRAA